MRKHTAAIVIAAMTAGLTASAMTTGAMAEADRPDARLQLTVSEETGRPLARALLECGPPGGTHPEAEAACTALTEVGGDIRSLPPEGGACPMVYRPVTLRAAGHWHDDHVDYTETFNNRCLAESRTGGVVFDF